MNFEVSPEQRALIEKTQDFCVGTLAPQLRSAKPGVFPQKAWRLCAQAGLHGLAIPQELGGQGLDPVSTVLVLETLGREINDLGFVFSLGAQLCAATVPLHKWDEGKRHDELLKSICGGEAIVSCAMTEPTGGSDISNLSTKAVVDDNSIEIAGGKSWITNAPIATHHLTYASVDAVKGLHAGMTAILVPSDTPGVTSQPIANATGHKSSALGSVDFDRCKLPASSVIGNPGGGFWVFNDAMNWERVGLFAAHLGACDRLLTASVEFAKNRKQEGVPIASHQAISHRLADMKMRLEAGRLLIYRAASRLNTSRQVGLDASMAKLFVSESFLQAAIDAGRIHGASGYREDSPIGSSLTDAMGALHYSGTSDIQRNIIARWLGL